MTAAYVDDPAMGLVRADHPDTSYAAAALVAPRSGTQRRAVLDYIAGKGDDGATDLEIQEELDMPGSTERPRRVELVDAELIVDSGRRRYAKGRSRIVWVAR